MDERLKMHGTSQNKTQAADSWPSTGTLVSLNTLGPLGNQGH
jgi:hypothetical protein